MPSYLPHRPAAVNALEEDVMSGRPSGLSVQFLSGPPGQPMVQPRCTLYSRTRSPSSSFRRPVSAHLTRVGIENRVLEASRARGVPVTRYSQGIAHQFGSTRRSAGFLAAGSGSRPGFRAFGPLSTCPRGGRCDRLRRGLRSV